jgi:hypothetical protein
MDGNFDAVMSLAACIVALEESHNKYVKQQETYNLNNELQFITQNKSLFRNQHNKHTNFKL